MRAADSRIFVEADGELLGTLPAAISIVPDALALLVPDVGRTLLSAAFDFDFGVLIPWQFRTKIKV